MSDTVVVTSAVAVDDDVKAGVEPQPSQAQADPLSKLERLILAQAVYELGSDAWTSVSRILSQHPLITKRDNTSFSPSVSSYIFYLILSYNSSLTTQACQNIYHYLLRAVGLDRCLIIHRDYLLTS
jgi:hypothetical protein